MLRKNILLILLVCSSFFTTLFSYPDIFDTKHFKIGVEYDHSLPMNAGSDKYRHRNNYDPFFVIVTASAKKNYVISYLEVTTTTDPGGEIDFHVIQGQTGSRTLVFQLVSNNTDFLRYSFLAYGIREDEYKKLANVITIPVWNKGFGLRLNHMFNFVITLLCIWRFI